MSERRQAKALVVCVVTVETGTWGPDCTLDQVTKQAKQEALSKLNNLRVRVAADRDRPLGDMLDGIYVTEVRSVRVVMTEEKA